MKHILLLFSFALVFIISSCKGDGPDGQDIDRDSTNIDTVMIIDTVAINPIDTVSVDSAGYINEEEALTSQIEKIYGEQWDFCDCVVKNDSVNNAIMETEEDAQIDLILERMDVIDQHCKEMLIMANTTPDERAKHERKVRKCLKAAK